MRGFVCMTLPRVSLELSNGERKKEAIIGHRK